MPSRRDYSEEYRRRQERAREEGYASDYERRMERDAPPGGWTPEEAEFRRGHRGEEFIRDYAQPGDLLMVNVDDRDSRGRFTSLSLLPEGPDRPERLISLRGMDQDELAALLDDLLDVGVAIDPDYLEKLT